MQVISCGVLCAACETYRYSSWRFVYVQNGYGKRLVLIVAFSFRAANRDSKPARIANEHSKIGKQEKTVNRLVWVGFVVRPKVKKNSISG